MRFITIIPICLSLISSCLAAPSQIASFQQDSRSGQYNFNYNEPMSARSEFRSPDGMTRGSYSYIDANGQLQTSEYEAGQDLGFLVKASNLPQAPMPIQEAPELVAARQKHLQLLEEANRKEANDKTMPESKQQFPNTLDSKKSFEFALKKEEIPEAFRKFYEQSEIKQGLPKEIYQQLENKPLESSRSNSPISTTQFIPEFDGKSFAFPEFGSGFFKDFTADSSSLLLPKGNVNFFSSLPDNSQFPALPKNDGNFLTLPKGESKAMPSTKNEANNPPLPKGDDKMMPLPKGNVNSLSLPKEGSDFLPFTKENEKFLSFLKSGANSQLLQKSDANFIQIPKTNIDPVSLLKTGPNFQSLPNTGTDFSPFSKENTDFLALPKSGDDAPSLPNSNINLEQFLKGNADFLSLPKSDADAALLPKSNIILEQFLKGNADFLSLPQTTLNSSPLFKSDDNLLTLPKSEILFSQSLKNNINLQTLPKSSSLNFEPTPQPQGMSSKAPEQRVAVPLPEQVKDTPEVAAAREAHLQAVAEAASKSAEPVKDTPEVMAAREAHLRDKAQPKTAMPIDTPKYTPEVQAARDAHFRAFELAAKLAAVSDINPKILEQLLGRPGEPKLGPQRIEGLESYMLNDQVIEELKRLMGMAIPAMGMQAPMAKTEAPKENLPQPPDNNRGIINLAEKPQLKDALKMPEINLGTGNTPASTSLKIPDTRLSALNEFEQSKLKAAVDLLCSTTLKVKDLNKIKPTEDRRFVIVKSGELAPLVSPGSLPIDQANRWKNWAIQYMSL